MRKVKNRKTVALMSILLVLTLISACLMTGTLARYVTSGTGVDTARVARWGVVVEASSITDESFRTEYTAEDGNFNGTLSVKSSNDERVIAPGTKGTISNISISGVPEVASRVSVVIDDTRLEGWDSYEPVRWTLSNDGNSIVDGGTLLDLTMALEGIAKDFEPNVDLGNAFNYKISWEWPFVGDDDVDTYLGNKAAQGDAPTIYLGFTILVEQID